MPSTLRIGIVGLGANCRLRHVPGLLECPDVEIVAVCNRRPTSTREAAREFGIPWVFERWRDLVKAEGIDAVVVGTWPYLHHAVTLAALRAGKHVLCEARMAMDVVEAREMLQAQGEHPELIAQLVPSPFGLRVHRTLVDLLAGGYLGELREVVVEGTSDACAEPDAAFHWRHSAEYCGYNALILGILHETLGRWVPEPVRLVAASYQLADERRDPVSGEARAVGTPDGLHVLSELPGGARGLYRLSAAVRFGPPPRIALYGSEGTLVVLFQPEERLLGARAGADELREIPIPVDKEGCWQVERDFIEAIRGADETRFTDFAAGVRYMEFTDAVARSASEGCSVELPLQDAP